MGFLSPASRIRGSRISVKPLHVDGFSRSYSPPKPSRFQVRNAKSASKRSTIRRYGVTIHSPVPSTIVGTSFRLLGRQGTLVGYAECLTSAPSDCCTLPSQRSAFYRNTIVNSWAAQTESPATARQISGRTD